MDYFERFDNYREGEIDRVERRFDKLYEALDRQYHSGLITQNVYEEDLRDLNREYREALREVNNLLN